MKNFILLSSLLILSLPSWAAQEVCENECQSQLMRMEIDNGLLQSSLSTDSLRNSILPAADSFFHSDAFQTNFIKNYPMLPMSVPFNRDQCVADKARGSVRYRNVNCDDLALCSNTNVPEDIRNELCFQLPCAMIKGAQLMGQCPARSSARPTILNFTDPLSLKKLDLTPLSVTAEGNTIRGCFRVNQLDLSIGIGIDFDQNMGVSYDRLGLSNLKLNLDSPREVCMSAKINLAASPQISEIKVETPAGQTFVSDEMINDGLAEAVPYGLNGYTPETLNRLRVTAIPPIARHFRGTIEDAVKLSLGQTFELQLATMLGTSNANGSSTVSLPADSIITELGVANMAVKKYVDLMECSITKAERGTIPADSSCLTLKFFPRNRILRLQDIPTPEQAVAILTQQMARYDQVTSESLKARLEALRPRLTALNKASLYNSGIQPLVTNIVANRPDSPLLQGLSLITGLSRGGTHTAIGLSLPKICNTEAPSPHVGHSIEGCPIQTYIDLEEMNNVLAAMYQSGRLCHSGRGDYTPERRANGRQVYNNDDSPRGQGCLFAIEEDPDGMRCFLNGAPKLKFDPATNGYKVDFKTKDCFRGGVFAGIGKIGGDINFEIGFTPNFCDGDFCIENGTANWNVVPGTARYALRDSSFLNGIVRGEIDKQLTKVLGETIRIPLSRSQGPLANVPLVPDGRVDTGPGYFGACLKYR